MGKAKYMVFIPSEAPNVALAAHHYLTYGPLATLQATVHHGTPFDTLTVFAEDTPEIDSHMKQLGVFVGEVANAPTITVTKEAGKGISTWEMRNPHYTDLSSQSYSPSSPAIVGGTALS